jgi:hypothetical protein
MIFERIAMITKGMRYLVEQNGRPSLVIAAMFWRQA